MRRSDATDPPEEPPNLSGLAACLAMLEIEARALGHPLAAGLIAAAGEALRRPAEVSVQATPRRD